MKLIFAFCILSLILTGFSPEQGENVELVCIKTLKAANTCHFNFKVEGAKYHYIDIGCKFSKKKEEVLKKAQAGDLGLARDWKLDCPEVKKDTTGK
jgi:hypothetical protein